MASIGSLGSLNLLAQAAAAVPAESSNPLRPLNGKRPAEHPAEAASESKNAKKDLASRVSKLEEKIEQSLEIQKRILALLERSPALPPQLPPAFSDDVLLKEGIELMKEGMAKRSRSDNSQKIQRCFQKAFDIFANVNPLHPQFQAVQKHMANCKCQLSLLETNLEKKQKLFDEAVKLNPSLPPPPLKSADTWMTEGRQRVTSGVKFQMDKPQKSQRCFQEAFEMFSNVSPQHAHFKTAQMQMGSCKYQLSLLEVNPEEKQKLRDEAVKFFPALANTIPNYKPSAPALPAAPKSADDWIKEGHDKRLLAMAAKNPQEKQKLIQEAFDSYSKVGPNHPKSKSAQYELAGCKVALAQGEANPQERQKLIDEAENLWPGIIRKPPAPALPPAPK